MAADQTIPREPWIRILWVSLVATIGGFLFGFDSGVINGTVEALQRALGSSALGTGLNVASMLLGCAAGAFFAGNLTDIFGRRAVMLAIAVAFMISGWGSGIASYSAEFIFYRVLGGLAVGAASVIVPAYISEIVPARIRGRFTALQQLAIVTGLFMAFVSNYLLASAAGGASETFWWGFETWQWMFWVEIIPAALYFVMLLFVPESPRYLVAIGKEVRAAAVLAQFGARRDAVAKVEEIRKTLVQDRRPRFSDMLQNGRVRPIVWVGLGLAALQQFVGINVVFYYGAVLWRAVGFSEAHALLINVITGAINISATFVAIALVDRVGRRPLLLVGSVGMALALGVLALVFGLAPKGTGGDLSLGGTSGVIALLAANAYVLCFGFSWGPVMWVMLGEMFPNQIRGSALSVAGLSQWGSNFLITISFPMLLAWVGLGFAYGFYALCAFISFFFVWYVVAETKGKSLEQME